MQQLRLSGAWWLPHAPENEVAGILTFDPVEGALLELIGHFGGTFESIDLLGQAPAPRIIHGVGDGKSISLLGIANLGSGFSTPGTVKQRFRAALVLDGELVPSPEDVKFQQLRLSYTHLQEWAGLSGLTLRYGTDFNQVTFQKPEDIVMTSTECSLSLRTYGGWRPESGRQYTVYESTELLLELREPLSFDDCWTTYIHPIRNFLTLATGHSNAPTSVIGNLTQPSDQGANNNVRVLFSLSNWPVTTKRLAPIEFIFSRRQAKEQLSEVLANWLRVSRELEPVCDLLFSTRYNTKMYANQRFLSLVQGLEAYHRRRFKNHILARKDHEERLNQILKAVPSQHREWLKNALAWSNEPSLKDRLDDLLNSVEPCLNSLIPDTSTFIRLVRDTRNYLTHFDSRLAQKAARKEKLVRLIHEVHFLLVACLLVEIGFSVTTVQEFLEHHLEFRQLITKTHERP